MDELQIVCSGASGVVINKIKPNSKILEFGPAYGRMTKYLYERLQCEVDIVELNKEDFEISKQYANIALNENIDEFKWVDELKNEKYDYILFMDVLEHLRNPEQALLYCKDLLKDDGILYFSVPNITHGDIIMNMYLNNFTYTNIGLLDDTHIHFWGLNNLLSIIQNLKYVGTYYRIQTPLFGTEQSPNKELIPPILITLLENRTESTTYQYLFEVQNEKEV